MPPISNQRHGLGIESPNGRRGWVVLLHLSLGDCGETAVFSSEPTFLPCATGRLFDIQIYIMFECFWYTSFILSYTFFFETVFVPTNRKANKTVSNKHEKVEEKTTWESKKTRKTIHRTESPVSRHQRSVSGSCSMSAFLLVEGPCLAAMVNLPLRHRRNVRSSVSGFCSGRKSSLCGINPCQCQKLNIVFVP